MIFVVFKIQSTATSLAMKFGAGPPCTMDIAIISPQSLKSCPVNARVDWISFPSQKNLLWIKKINSTKNVCFRSRDNKVIGRKETQVARHYKTMGTKCSLCDHK